MLWHPVGVQMMNDFCFRGFGEYAFTPGYLVCRRWRQKLQ